MRRAVVPVQQVVLAFYEVSEWNGTHLGSEQMALCCVSSIDKVIQVFAMPNLELYRPLASQFHKVSREHSISLAEKGAQPNRSGQKTFLLISGKHQTFTYSFSLSVDATIDRIFLGQAIPR
jgi:hypothetical protein